MLGAVLPRVASLSIHADYRCRHSGHCCSTDWDVPLELPVYRTLEAALRAGSLTVSAEAAGLEPFVREPNLPDDTGAIFARTEEGLCVFFERGSNLCIVHRDLGESALPATCRHFPRLAVADGRGTSITLSHFCPTAASMLFRDDVSVAIVEQPPAFPLRDYDGLSVGPEDLPPLLTPGMLMDLEGYAAWERHMVARCAALTRRPESVVATLVRDARALGGWRPGRTSLPEAVGELPADFVDASLPSSLVPSLALHSEVIQAVPDEFRPEPDEAGLEDAFLASVREPWDSFRAPLDRYLAGKAFASWTAYQGRGVATIVRGLEAALALVRVESARQCRDAGRPLDATLLLEAFRAADFTLNHLAVGEDLATAWASAEARQSD
jgi:Fe-S-cluster containining protein